jgi:anti-sigma28 factor (negative regulator of flagellin synthesis)
MHRKKGRMITRSNNSMEKSPTTKEWTGRPTLPFPRPFRRSTPIRKELVDRLRAEIANGNYDTPERFDAAIVRMLRRFNLD